MDLPAIFPNGSVCLFSNRPRQKVWRIINISAQALNYLRIWLETQVISVAVNWIQVQYNTSDFYDEYIAHRIGLIPIEADPLRMENFNGETTELCSEDTCILFDLNVFNVGSEIRNVTSNDLRWIPIGNQAQRWLDRPPRPMENILIAKIRPGQEINLRCYAVRGTGEQHAKWASTLSHFRLVSTRSNRSNVMNVRSGVENNIMGVQSECLPCEQLKVNLQNGQDCYYFTVELIGGLTFEDINRQLMTLFSWEGGPSFDQPQYIY